MGNALHAQHIEEVASKTGFTVDQVRKIMEHWPGGQEEMAKPSFRKFLARSASVLPSVPGLNDPAQSDLLFDVFDSDHSGKVSFHEFFGGVAVLAKGTPDEKARLVFSCIDLNGDGKITRKEFTRAIREIIVGAKRVCHVTGKEGPGFYSPAVGFDTSRFMKLVFQSDDNKDGVISLEEWLNHYKTNPAIQRVIEVGMGKVKTEDDVLHQGLQDFGTELGKLDDALTDLDQECKQQ